MRHFYFKFLMILFYSVSMYAQRLDTLVNVGGYKIHFSIMKGEGTPILLEAGAGNDGSIWNGIFEKIHKATGTTVITYDRSGFGKSELNPNLKNESDFGIVNGIKELETSLSKLGFDNEIVLVSHSYGGLYNLLYASKHPNKVKSVILIDATLSNFWNEEFLTMRDNNFDISAIEKPSGDYYLHANYNETMRYVRNLHFPENTPIINIFPENSFSDAPEIFTNRWRKLHKEFGDLKDNVTNIIAKGSGHYVFQDNPALVINAIIKAYSITLDEEQQIELLQKALDNAIKLSIEPNIKSLLITQLINSHTNQQWFIPTKKAIEGLTLEQSNWKDNTNNHSIAEQVSHLIFYNELILKAYKGESYIDINDDEENKETFKFYKGKDWQNAVKKLDSLQTEWENITKNATEEQIAEWNVEIANISAHTAYHTGQIIYIRKHNGWWETSK